MLYIITQLTYQSKHIREIKKPQNTIHLFLNSCYMMTVIGETYMTAAGWHDQMESTVALHGAVFFYEIIIIILSIT